MELIATQAKGASDAAERRSTIGTHVTILSYPPIHVTERSACLRDLVCKERRVRPPCRLSGRREFNDCGRLTDLMAHL